MLQLYTCGEKRGEVNDRRAGEGQSGDLSARSPEVVSVVLKHLHRKCTSLDRAQ